MGHFYPYGQEKPSATQNGTEKFTGISGMRRGMDYAINRYHVPGTGRFLTPDPYMNSAGPTEPGSWNRYAYTRGDPINRVDRTGLDECPADISYMLKDGDVCQPAFSSGGVYGTDDGGDEGGGCYVDDLVESPECYDPPPPPNPNPPSQPPAPAPSSPPPCPPQYQAWINAYGADAVATGLTEANVLALSAIESGWGTGRFATQGKDFFNLETVWKPGTPQPAPQYAYQTGWLQAKEMFTSGPNRGKYTLVATYNSASDSFKSFAARYGTVFAGVTDAATFGKIAVANGEYGGRGTSFVTTAQIFMDCLGHN